ncbi:endonuclease/exonuclease/phosphatase family protein [Rufibacter roseus]|uniref:Endonuclease/exonuclease/phosphatase family protein n=1 Tax=Rufibacter roseus TaxID=1567108 RepID=A0ABW2DLE0_9BACT|nr:endonuclease/exonuclease/phosphatase family protein [Rufibacter roseus]
MYNLLSLRRFFCFLLFVCLFVTVGVAQAQTLKIATYNIRYDEKRDTANAWVNRLPYITDLIQFHELDIVGTQEGLHHQLQDLDKALEKYAYIGAGRDDGKEKGEFAAIFYRKDKFQLLESGTFWLSPTPEKPSKGWDAALNRVCTWGHFKNKTTGKSFLVYNIHFDHRGIEARKESSKQLLALIKAKAVKTPVVLMGDFNFDQNHENYALLNQSVLVKDAFDLAPIKFAPKGTFNGFDVTRNSDQRIDHIFLTQQFQVKKYGILTYTYGSGKLPSDHYPVVVELALKGK